MAISSNTVATVASAGTTDISVAGDVITISGTTTITGFTLPASGKIIHLIFSGILTLTHNASSLILPGAANIVTAAGDSCDLLSLGSNNARVLRYSRADGTSVKGSLIKTTALINGTSFTTQPGTSILIVRAWAAGGGGGGTTGSAANSAAGSGGGSGGYAMKTFAVAGNTAYSYAIGAKGNGGSTSGGNGADGGDTTFTVGGTTITAKGGKGGTGMVFGTTPATLAGGAGGAISTSGDVNGGGVPGGWALRVGASIAAAGNGGSTSLGGGGLGAISSIAGPAAIANTGSGGAGGCAVGAGNNAGGNGADGIILIEEFS